MEIGLDFFPFSQALISDIVMLDFLANFFLEMTTDLLRAHLNDGSVRSTKMEGSLLDMVDNRFNRPRSVCCVFERFDLRRYSLRS